jgi:ASC-1-like (ASCH) protein
MEITVNEPWFIYIMNGQKTVEGRLRKGKFLDLKRGDIVTIINSENTRITKKIKRVTNYISFSNMIILEGIDNILPGVHTLEEGIQIYRQFYTKEMEEEFGVIAIEIEPV